MATCQLTNQQILQACITPDREQQSQLRPLTWCVKRLVDD
jgi:hypothetical protein